MFQRPLICTDFTDHLDRLIHFVPSLAAGGLKQIVFLHNVPLSAESEIPRPEPAQLDAARARLGPAQQQRPDGVTVELEVQSGQSVEVILQAAARHQADVIILGTQSRNLLTETLFGSDTVALTQRSPIPLMVLRPQLIGTYTAEELALRCQHLFQRLLLPYDDSPAAQYAVGQLQAALQTHPARHPDRPVQAVIFGAVIDAGGRYEAAIGQRQAELQTHLTATQAALESLGLTVTLDVRLGSPVSAILATAQDYAVSAIVVSSNHVNSLLRFSAPSFAAEILRQSWHPVIFFPSPPN